MSASASWGKISRAALIKVFSTSGDKAAPSSAHASPMLRPVLPAIAAAGTVTAAPLRKTRRSYWLRLSTSLMCFLPHWTPRLLRSVEAPASLDHLDPIAVRVADEEETRERRARMFQLAQRTGRKLLARKSRMLGLKIVDHEGDVAVAVAQLIGRLAIEIHRELELERR